MKSLFVFAIFALTLCAQTSLRVNVGGSSYTDGAGNTWSADTGCTSTSTFTSQVAITGTGDPTLYQTGRTDPSLVNCTYAVNNYAFYYITLLFAEYNSSIHIGSRIFNIFINNVNVAPSFDPLARSRLTGAAIPLTFGPIPVSTGQISITLATVSGSPILQGVDIEVATISSSIPGVFTNTLWSDAFVGSVNSASPRTIYQIVQGSNFATNGLSAAIAVPIGSTIQGANGVFGGITNASTGTNAVGVQGYAICTVDLSKCWGANFLAEDLASLNNISLFGIEVDTNVNNTSTTVIGISLGGASTVTPTNGDAILINALGVGHPWPGGIVSSDGATTALISGGRASSSGSSNSQLIQLNSFDGSNAFLGQFYFDAAGSAVINPDVVHSAGQFKVDKTGNPGTTPVQFSTLPTCDSNAEGKFRAVTNSTTATWGATITGGGGNHVLAYCDGTNWTVMAK